MNPCLGDGEIILNYPGDPEHGHTSPYKREAKGTLSIKRGEGNVTLEAELGVVQPQTREHQ